MKITSYEKTAYEENVGEDIISHSGGFDLNKPIAEWTEEELRAYQKTLNFGPKSAHFEEGCYLLNEPPYITCSGRDWRLDESVEVPEAVEWRQS